MAETVIDYVAYSAQQKLSCEASKADLDLRRLLGHSSVLDFLAAELFEHKSSDSIYVTGINTKPTVPTGHIRWADQVLCDAEDEWDAEPNDSEDSEDSQNLDFEGGCNNAGYFGLEDSQPSGGFRKIPRRWASKIIVLAQHLIPRRMLELAMPGRMLVEYMDRQ